MNYVPRETCGACYEFKPHYCAAIIKISNIRLPRHQGQRTKWRKTVVITDRMPPYETSKSERITITKFGGTEWHMY